MSDVEQVLAGETSWCVVHSGCLDVLRAMPDNSVDSCVCDPPYGLGKNGVSEVTAALRCWLDGKEYRAKGRGFMSKTWDSFVPGPEVWREVERVLKPGGHALVFAGTRTVDLMGLAMRLAGFEMRESLAWMFASGMPKSLDVSKEMDRLAGAEREVVGPVAIPQGQRNGTNALGGGWQETPMVTAPSTPEAKQWQGFGTATKPAFEPIIVARKELDGTIAANVLKWGTGAMNIDATRVDGDMSELLSATGKPRSGMGHAHGYGMGEGFGGDAANPPNPLGRWPANVMLDEQMADELDRQSGNRPGMSGGGKHAADYEGGMFGGIDCEHTARGDSGGASRFFFVARHGKDDQCSASFVESNSPENPRGRGFVPDRAPREPRRKSAGKLASCEERAERAAENSSLISAITQSTALDGARTRLEKQSVQSAPGAANLCGQCATSTAPSAAQTSEVHGEERPDQSSQVQATAATASTSRESQGNDIERSQNLGSGLSRERLHGAHTLSNFHASAAESLAKGTTTTTVNQPTRDGCADGATSDITSASMDPGALDCVPFRFVAKASRAERDSGLRHFRARTGGEATGRKDESAGTKNARAGQGRTGGARNHHATVKPVELLRQLVRLVTPPGGVVLDPFAGSGSCGVAARIEGFRFIGIEMMDSDDEPSVSVARARISWAEGREMRPRESLRSPEPPRQRSLFEAES